MGNLCLTSKKSQNFVFCNENEQNLLLTLVEYGYIEIDSIEGDKVTFINKELDQDQSFTFKKLIEKAIIGQNIFYLPTIFLTLIAIVDFIEILIKLQSMNKMSKFFLLNFEGFFLKKIGTHYSKLQFLDKSIIEKCDEKDFIFNQESNIQSELTSGLNEEGKKIVYDRLKVSETSNEIDINSAFYSKSRHLFEKSIKAPNSQNIDKFYCWSIVNFIYNFLIKKLKTFDSDLKLKNKFDDLRKRIKIVLSRMILIENLRTSSKITKSNISVQKDNDKEIYLNLSNLKKRLVFLYFNTVEFNIFNQAIEDVLKSTSGENEFLISKMLTFIKDSLKISYGRCDILYKKKQDPNHSPFNLIFEEKFSSEKLDNTGFKEVNEDKWICLKCMKNIFSTTTLLPEGFENRILLNDFLRRIKEQYLFVKNDFFLKFFFVTLTGNDKESELFTFRKQGKVFLTYDLCQDYDYEEDEKRIKHLFG